MKKLSILLSVAVMFSLSVFSQNPDLDLEVFSSGYNDPIDIGSCGDNRLFIVEKRGVIWVCDANGNKLSTPFLNITSKVYDNGSEQGLLGIAFHPNYKTNGFFYVNYINNNQNSTVSRFKVSPADSNRANKNSEKKILGVMQPASNHNGGCLKFGPDGYLYIGFGDGGGSGDSDNNAQNTNKFLGKMLRIDVDGGNPYAVPADNPFVGMAGYKPEIWAIGLRNPWRYSFDRVTGDLYISDVGQNEWEEVDFQPASSNGGENYGWRCYEANDEFNTNGCGPIGDYIFPVAEYQHGSDCSITGGYVYRGSLYPNMEGKYVVTDYCSGTFRMIYNDGTWHQVNLGSFDNFSYSTFGEDMNGELYVGSLTDGNIYHVIDASAFGVSREYSIQKMNGSVLSSFTIYPNPSDGKFNVEFTAVEEAEATFDVFDLTGRKILSEIHAVVKGFNTVKMKLPDELSGSYLLTVNIGQEQKSFVVLVE